jgi:hypothetical protein
MFPRRRTHLHQGCDPPLSSIYRKSSGCPFTKETANTVPISLSAQSGEGLAQLADGCGHVLKVERRDGPLCMLLRRCYILVTGCCVVHGAWLRVDLSLGSGEVLGSRRGHERRRRRRKDLGSGEARHDGRRVRRGGVRHAGRRSPRRRGGGVVVGRRCAGRE